MQLSTVPPRGKETTLKALPKLPVEYTQAVAALTACINIDDAKYWSDKADALAAWAKIYHSNDAFRKAKMLKMHAFRRMGQLAAEIRPRASNGRNGNAPGPVSLLKESGLNQNQATAARRLAIVTDKQFDKLLTNPKSPSTIVQDLWHGGDETWAKFLRTAISFRAVLRKYAAKEIAAICNQNERHKQTARELSIDIGEFFAELETRLK